MNKAEYVFEKIASQVKIPEGGLKPGLLYNDITQVMSDSDAKKVKEKYNVFSRSGPGLLVSSISGGTVGGTLIPAIKNILNKNFNSGKIFSSKGAAIGAGLGFVLPYVLTRSGYYDKQVLNKAKKLIEGSKK